MKVGIVVEDRYGSAMIVHVDNISNLRSIIIRLTNLDELVCVKARSKDGLDNLLILEDYSK